MKIRLLWFLVSLCLATSVFAIGQINIATAPYTINTSGSYILVKNLQSTTDQNAITINVSDVSIDLNGHTIYGAGTTTGSLGIGIYGFSGDNISISNGVIRDSRTYGIYLSGANCEITRMRIYANGSDAINIGSNGVVCNNTLRENGGDGINGGQSDVIQNNSIRHNGGDGIQVSGTGTIIGNNLYLNSGYGIRANNSSLIKNNMLNANGLGGIYTGNYSQIQENNCLSNIVGIYVTGSQCRIDNNLLVSNVTGLRIDGTGNFHDGNVLKSNTVDTAIAASNTEGNGVTGGFKNIVPDTQPNFLITYFAGYNLSTLQESREAILRNLIW